MTHRFAVSHATRGARGMRDLLHRQVQRAIAQLPQRQATDEQIHSARKHMKAARATLRLLRPMLSEAAYGRENRALRDAARVLSAARDDTVLLQTPGELTRETKGSGQRRRLSEFRARLQRDAGRRRSELARHGLRQSAARLRSALTMVDSWPTPPEDWKPVYRSLRASYRKGRCCARCNAQHATGPTLHEWRKCAKHLRSQLELIAPAQHASVEAMSTQLHKLSAHLGEEHDLAVLGEHGPPQRPTIGPQDGRGSAEAHR